MEEVNINFRRILLFSLILFLSLSVVSAEEVDNYLENVTTTLSSDEEVAAFEDTIEYSDEYYDYDYEFEEYDDFEEEYTDNDLNTDELLIENMDSIEAIKPFNQGMNLNSNAGVVSFSQSEIGLMANHTYTFISSNRMIPAVANVGNKEVCMNDLLYLICKSLNNTNNVSLGSFYHVTSSTGTNCPNRLFNRSEYLLLANAIVQCYEINGRNPKNINYYNYTISFDDALYFYSRIAAYKENKGTLIQNIRVLAPFNKDYSTEKWALTSNSTQPLTITATTSNNLLTLVASQNSAIYYTTNNTTPNINSNLYTQAINLSGINVVKYFAVNNNNERTPVLVYTDNQASLPYITSKTVLSSNGYENRLNISICEDAVIYYSLNGTKPSIQSPQYTGTLTINNNTLLQFFAVTIRNNKRSPTYYYRLQNPTPYVTILNTTDVRDNSQKITIIANKPGKIYYTLNGSTPTADDIEYTPGTILNISIKTQIKAVLIDSKNKQSLVSMYHPPQIVTPPTTIIQPLTTLVNNTQQIQFFTNNINATIHYTIDGTDPLTSNTTKTGKHGKIITIHKVTQLKYFTTDDIGEYASEVVLYRTPKNSAERPDITVFNTTGVYSDGTQRVMFQSNQPGTFNVTVFEEEFSQKIVDFSGELLLNNDSKIQVYTQLGGRYSKIIEYTPINGPQVIMFYNYTVKLPNINEYEQILFYINGNEVYYNINSPQLNNYVHIHLNDWHITTENTRIITNNEIIIHKSDVLEITYYNQMYGEINVVNAVMYSLIPQYETLVVYSNGTRLLDIFWKKRTINNENVTTIFQTLSNSFIKNETITYHSQYVGGCTNYDIVQSYILTNVKVTSEFYNQSLYNISHYNFMDDILRITPQDRTIMTGLTNLWTYDGYSEYIAHQLNMTAYRSNEVLCIVGVNYDRVNYVHFNDLTMGMVVQANSSSAFFFNLHTSAVLPEIARISLNMIRENLGKTVQTLFAGLNNESDTYVYTNNRTGIMKLYSSDMESVYLLFNTTSGILSSIIVLDGFEYNGAVSEPLIPEEGEIIPLNGLLRSSTMTCFEDNCNYNGLDKSRSLLNFSSNSGWADVESTLGSLAVVYGIGIAAGLITAPIAIPTILALTIAGAGFLAITDSHGIFSGYATNEDWEDYYVDLIMLPLGSGISKGISTIGKTVFKKIAMGQTVTLSSTEMTTQMYNIIWSINTLSSECISYARDKIVEVPVRMFMDEIRGYGG